MDSCDNYEIFLSTGDFSGDIHSAFLIKTLKNKYPNIKISGIGGDCLESTNINFLANIVSKQGFGFFSIFNKYIFFKNILNKIIAPYFKSNNISLLILVDFYGFNIHVAKLAKKCSIKVVYYICPQVWASRKSRIQKIKKYVDYVIPIFPFESEIYDNNSIESFYKGNPILDIINDSIYSDNDLVDVDSSKVNIALMPGSRETEIKYILPIFVKALEILSSRYYSGKLYEKVGIYLIISPNISLTLISKYINNDNLFSKIQVLNGPAYSLRKQMRFILTSSGTSSFESFLLGIPMMIFYKMDWVTYLIARVIVKIKYIGMPNILANRLIFPEYIQGINYFRLVDELYNWINNDQFIKDKVLDIKKVINSLNFSLDNRDRAIDRIVECIMGIIKK